MDYQIVHSRTLDQHREQEPHNVVSLHHEEEDEEHHEKKSILKKVKTKAKKIKNTIKKHAHGEHHDEHHDGQHTSDDHEIDEEDEDEDKEMIQDPEIHGAPIYETVAMRSALHGQAEYVAHPPGVHFERSNALREVPLESREKHQTKSVGPIGSSLPKENVITEPPKVGFGSKMAMGEGTPSPANTPVSADRRIDGQSENLFTAKTDHQKGTESTDPSRTFVGQEDKSGQTKVNLGSPMVLEEDPHGPSGMYGSSVSSNAQSKVAEPSGAGMKNIKHNTSEPRDVRMN